MKTTRILITGVAAFFFLSGSTFADYTIILKNDRRITVKKYWEEGGMVKFRGLGGEIGLSRQTIQSIIPASKSKPQGIVIANLKNTLVHKVSVNIVHSKQGLVEIPVVPEARWFEDKDKEQEEYQSVHRYIIDGIKSRTHRYWKITRGTIDPEPIIFEDLEDLEGRIVDSKSRHKDALYNPERARGTGIVNLITNSSFAGQKRIIGLRHKGVIGSGRVTARRVRAARVAILPAYTRSEKHLSDLRNHKDLFYQERERLMEGAEGKSIFSGSSPYEAYPSIQPQWWKDRYGRER